MAKDLIEEFRQMNAGGVGYLVTPENCDVARKWRHFFRYEDGHLIWRQKTGSKCKVGSRAGHTAYHGYTVIVFQKKCYKAHRIIWEMFKGEIDDKSLVIDHINRIKDDNRIENLRLVTKSENAKNASRSDRSKHGKHVYYDPRSTSRPWYSIIKKDGTQLCSPYFQEKKHVLNWLRHHGVKGGDA